MKKDLVEMVFILDRSGSMSGLEKDTIGGFNQMLEKQKQLPGDALVTTVLFDHEFQMLHDRLPVKEIKLMTGKEYYVRGSTALLDAVGKSIHHLVSIYKTTKPSEKPEKTIFIITTDGMENASRNYTYKDVKQLIETQKEKYNWEFIFLGANIDATEVAEGFGINRDRAANFHADKEGTVLNYKVISDTLENLRYNKKIDSNWKSKIDKDFKNRS